MQKIFCIGASLCLAVIINATPIDITVNDGLFTGNVAPDYIDGEDQAVNFGSSWGQEWDLEFFIFDNEKMELSMISGFDAFGAHEDQIMLGDIFIDINSNGSWDYVVNFNQGFDIFTSSDYTLVDLTVGNPAQFIDLVGDNNLYHGDALPYAYADGGIVIGSGSFVQTSFSDDQGMHYIMSGISLSKIIDNNTSFIVHETMGCGNDVIVGRVPEPSIITLLGLGLISLAFFRRKK